MDLSSLALAFCDGVLLPGCVCTRNAKDKSILFWRSLPVTDAETVISKLLTAVILLPALMAIGIFVTHIVNLVITSIGVMTKGGSASTLIWGSVPFLDNWTATLIVIMASGLWMSPFIGWFLLVSAWTKRMPLLVAFMPIMLSCRCLSGSFSERGTSRPLSRIAVTMIPLFRELDIEALLR